MILIKFLFISLLIYLIYYDWKSRSVYWVVFPVLFGLNICINFSDNLMERWLLNSAIILLQLCSILLYLKMKNYAFKDLFDKYFGLGDLLFLFVLSLSFNIEQYLVFNICTLLVSLVLAKLLKFGTVPFAGIQAIFLTIWTIWTSFLLGNG